MGSFKNHPFDPLMWSTEEHEESVYNHFISEVRNFRMCVEAHEEQLIRQIRSPLERDDLKAIMQRIVDQEVHRLIKPTLLLTITQLLSFTKLRLLIRFYTHRGKRQSWIV